MLPWKFLLLLHAQRSILVHSGSTNVQTVHISTFGTQQYWITLQRQLGTIE